MDLAGVTITLFAVPVPIPQLDYTNPWVIAAGILSVCGLVAAMVDIRRSRGRDRNQGQSQEHL
jgi:hypothetical protein